MLIKMEMLINKIWVLMLIKVPNEQGVGTNEQNADQDLGANADQDGCRPIHTEFLT